MKLTVLLPMLFALAAADARVQGEESSAPMQGRDWTVPQIDMEFVWVPAMECWVGKYEVTNGEFRAFKPDHDLDAKYENHSLSGDRQPVVNVGYDDAKEYAEWLTGKEQKAGRLYAGLKYRLPKGDEWTKFAQCGDNRQYPWGNEWPPKYGNFSDKASAWSDKIEGYEDGFAVTCPVEKSGKNDWGLYGVAGNVWEWTSERHPRKKENRLLRGASWNDFVLFYPLCSYRCDFRSSYRDSIIGFRLVLAR